MRNSKNKVLNSPYREINPNFLFEWNSKFRSSFDGNWFFLALRCNQELAGQIWSKSKVTRFSSEFSNEFQLIEVSWILVQILFWIWRNFYKESCSLSEALSIHILFEIFRAMEDNFWIGQSLGQIWIRLKSIWFGLKIESGALCCRPHLSAPRWPPHCAALRRTQPLTTGPP
jgi:hypothetical protein